ncbi:hypothetical protein [Zhongshania sp.]|uniref:hypothetical protein n=1 Tax=Zhongshania sp. TaxID=1971902 RepID=UPI003565BEAF
MNLEDEKKRIEKYEEWYAIGKLTFSELQNQRKLVHALEQLERAREALGWAEGQFAGIRMYTQDGKIAVACADGETRIKQALKQQEVGNE